MNAKLTNLEIILMELEMNKTIMMDMTNNIIKGELPNDEYESVCVISQCEHQIQQLIKELKDELV